MTDLDYEQLHRYIQKNVEKFGVFWNMTQNYGYELESLLGEKTAVFFPVMVKNIETSSDKIGSYTFTMGLMKKGHFFINKRVLWVQFFVEFHTSEQVFEVRISVSAWPGEGKYANKCIRELAHANMESNTDLPKKYLEYVKRTDRELLFISKKKEVKRDEIIETFVHNPIK